MLARTFLTARELKCSEIERQAAVSVLGMLERGELRQAPIEILAEGRKQSIPSDAFNIMCWKHCMAGWMERTKGRELSQQCWQRWSDLFEPEGWDRCEEYYTPERCARALNAKLTTGRAVWD